MKIERPKSLTGLVVEELRARIIDGRLRLGEGLSENVLAADLGISKTPVREALLQLKLERLVDVLPQRGTYVFRLSRNEVVMISELREMLELAAAAAAIERNHAALVARMSEIYQDMTKAHQAGDKAQYGSAHLLTIPAVVVVDRRLPPRRRDRHGLVVVMMFGELDALSRRCPRRRRIGE